MIFGILKEPDFEHRVSLLPDAVQQLIGMGNSVVVEIGAGETAFKSDETYKLAGASIASKSDIFAQANIFLKIQPPTEEELRKMKSGSGVISMLQPLVNKELVASMKAKNLTAFSMDAIPRISRAQSMDVLSSMSTIAGYKAVLLGAANLPRFFPMLMTAAGTIAPAKMLIIGAGVAGLQAIATAKRLGAVVEAFDTRWSTKEQVESLGGKFVVVEGAVEDAKAGGYAVEQNEEFKKKQAEAIHNHAIKSDVVITTALIPGRRAPILITKETVAAMKPGAVIVDLASANGGNCELAEDNKTVVHNGVSIIGNSNLASTMPEDASRMYGKNMMTFLKLLLNKDGSLNLNLADDIISGTCITHAGEFVNAGVKKAMGS